MLLRNSWSHLLIVICVGAVLASSPVHAGAEEKNGPPASCWLEGAWIGDVEAGGHWLATFSHKTPNSGSFSLQFYDFPASFFDPAAEQFGETVGVFQKTGPKTFDYTMWTYAIDGFGFVVYSFKDSGSITLSPDCQSAATLGTSEYVTAFGDFCIPSASTAVRMTVDEGCTP